MRDVATAVGDLLGGQSGLHWFDGVIDGKPDRYVVFYLTPPRPEGDRASGSAPFGLYTLATLYFGKKPGEARWVVEKVHAALKDRLLLVPDRAPALISLGSVSQILPDDSINPSAWTGTDVWRFVISPGEPDA